MKPGPSWIPRTASAVSITVWWLRSGVRWLLATVTGAATLRVRTSRYTVAKIAIAGTRALLLALFHLAKQSASVPRRRRGRCHRGTVRPLEAPALDLLGRRGRCEIFVEFTGPRPRHVAFGQCSYPDDLSSAEWPPNNQPVIRSDQPVRLRRLAIDLDLAVPAGLLGIRPRSEQTRNVQPDIETNSFNWLRWHRPRHYKWSRDPLDSGPAPPGSPR